MRVPRRLHRPRGQAGAAHHPQVRRRLRLRDHRPRDHQAPGPRPALRPDPLRHRRPAGPAPQHGLGHRPQGRLAARRRRGRARPDRQRARSRPQDPAHPRGHPAQADGAARGGDRAGPRGGRRGATRPRSRRPGGDRTTGGHRGREVRRPVGGARQRVRLRPRPDGLAHRQHRALPPVRRGADPLDLPHRRHLAGRRDDPDRPHRAGGARARPGPAGVRRGRRARRRPARAAPALRLPLRPGPALLGVLRAVPGPQGRHRGPRLAAGALRDHPRRPRPGPRPPRDRRVPSRCERHWSGTSPTARTCRRTGSPATCRADGRSGARRSYPGCRDRTPPRDVVGLRLAGPHRRSAATSHGLGRRAGLPRHRRPTGRWWRAAT